MALPSLEAIHMCTILEDMIHQLGIIGEIMPNSYKGSLHADQMISNEVSHLMDVQSGIESKYSKLQSEKNDVDLDEDNTTAMKTIMKDKVDDAATHLGHNTRILSQSLKHSPLGEDNIAKVQADRTWVESVLRDTFNELKTNNTYNILKEAVKGKKESKNHLQDTIMREEEGRKRVKYLQKQLSEIKTKTDEALNQRVATIAHLKDQCQELKAKTSMEEKYIKKREELRVAENIRRCEIAEKELYEEIKNLHQQLDNEVRSSSEIETHLKSHQTVIENKIDDWMDKHENEVAQKQHELEVLKASRAKDAARMKELSKLFTEYEKVVVEDRIEKEKARRKAEQEQEEVNSAIMVQSWWRGVMVRNSIGAFKRKKKTPKSKGKTSKKQSKSKKKK